MTAALTAALRACAAGLCHSEAGTELLIRHGTFLARPDFAACICEDTSFADGTPMAAIDWDAAITALQAGNLPASSGERSILQLAASIANGNPVALRFRRGWDHGRSFGGPRRARRDGLGRDPVAPLPLRQ